MYLAIKELHMVCVALSLVGFVARGLLMLGDSSLVRNRLVRVLPHVVDTLLLVSALYLASQVIQEPGEHGWLLAKLAGLVAYVVLGVIALRLGKSPPVRVGAFFAALLVFGWVVTVAITKNPAGALAGLF